MSAPPTRSRQKPPPRPLLGGGAGGHHRWRALTLLALVWLWAPSLPISFGADAAVSKEYKLKAAFIYNFTKFVDWPPERFRDKNSPLIISVLGNNPFGEELTNLVKDRSVNGHPIIVRFIESAYEVRYTHILFIAGEDDARLDATLFNVRGVLTVGESAAFAARGGIIRFILVDEKVRFEINQASGENAGLRLSGQLLKLATVARPAP